jgi:hypothetical protein
VRRVRPIGTLLALVIVLVGGGIWWIFFRDSHSSAECAPVRELLSYNNTRIDTLNAKTHIPEEGSFEAATEPSDLDYQEWANGVGDRAQKVTADDLGAQARDAARTAGWLAQAMADYSAQSKATAPGAQPPASGMVVKALNDQYGAQISKLSQECPG